jgi:hypothetical protein
LATILIKNVPEDVLKELKRLKVELGCRTWAELLSKLAEPAEAMTFSEEELARMKAGAGNFLKLRKQVSKAWAEGPGVLEEMRRSRHHGRR